MKFIKIGIFSVSLLALIGCSTTQPRLDTAQKQIRKGSNGKYYALPFSKELRYEALSSTRKVVFISAISNGMINCKKDYMFVRKAEVSNEMSKKIKKWFKAIPQQEKVKAKDSRYIPGRNTSEYKDLASYVTSEYRKGSIRCYRPFSKQETLQYKNYIKQQNKINNDPRVVAARIQAQSASDIAAAQIKAADDRATWNNLSRQTAQMQQQNNQFLRDNYVLNRMGY